MGIQTGQSRTVHEWFLKPSTGRLLRLVWSAAFAAMTERVAMIQRKPGIARADDVDGCHDGA